MERRAFRKGSTTSGLRRHPSGIGWQSDAFTERSDNAPAGQMATQCPHSMHCCAAAATATGPSGPFTIKPSGQTAAQMPSRRHFVLSTSINANCSSFMESVIEKRSSYYEFPFISLP